jgi:hypothetical protein
MRQYNGISLISSSVWSKPDAVLATDACLTGLGGVAFGSCFHSNFPDFIIEQQVHISGLEALAVSVALKLWATKLTGLRLRILCDNSATVCVINSGRTKDPFLLRCMREICYTSAIGGFQVRAEHIPGVDNRLPDLLSRWDLEPKARAQFLTNPAGAALLMLTAPDELFSFNNNW